MNNLTNFQKRAFLFIFGCIGSRLLITYISSIPAYTKIIGLLALIPAIGFIIIYIFGLRKTGAETLGAPIWWNNLRPIHALSLIIFSIMALQDYTSPNAWIVLLIDTLFGATAWGLHHFVM
jgi:hypothetical protein